MQFLKPKVFLYYILFGAAVYFSYGLFCNLWFTPPPEGIWWRWPVFVLGLTTVFIGFYFNLSLKWVERLFYLNISVLLIQYLYIFNQANQPSVYFHGFFLTILGCSLMIFRKKMLLYFMGLSFPFAMAISLNVDLPIPVEMRAMNVFCFYVFLYSITYLKIYLFEVNEENLKEVAIGKVKLEETYKRNLQAAHDLHSPASAIKAVADKIKYENKKYYEMLESSVEKINAISADLLKEHVEKKMEVEQDFFDLENNISQIIKDKRIEYGGIGNLFIIYRVTNPIIGEVKIPKTEFHRVLSNIINNSLEAMKNEQMKRVNIVIDPRADMISILISDNGKGIPQDKIPYIFDENMTNKPSGHGLGLSYAKKKVTDWGGKIELKSSNEKGSTFEIILPYYND